MSSSDENNSSVGSDFSGLISGSVSDSQKSASSSKSRSKESSRKSTQESPAKPSQEQSVKKKTQYDVPKAGGKFKKWEHETMSSLFKKQEDECDRLLATKNIIELKEYVTRNYKKFIWCDFLQHKIEELVDTFANTDQKMRVLHFDKNADNMIWVLREILEEAQRKVAAVDVSFDISGTLEGSVLNALVEKSRKKMTEVIEDLQRQIRDQNAVIGILQGNNMDAMKLEADLRAAREYIKHLRDRDKYEVEDPPCHNEFIDDLQFQLQSQEQMNSSLLEELENERRTKEEYLEQYLRLESLRVYEHQERLKEIADATKDLELDKGIRKGITEKIKTLTAKPEEIEEAVNDWLKATHEVLKPKHKEIHELKASIKSTDDEIAKLRQEADQMFKDLRRAEDKVEEMTKEMEKYYESLRKQERLKVAEQNEYVSSLRRTPREMGAIPEVRQFDYSRPGGSRPGARKRMTEKQYSRLSPSMKARLQPDQVPASARSRPLSSLRNFFSNIRTPRQRATPSPETFRQESPEYMQEQFDGNSPIEILSTPPAEVPRSPTFIGDLDNVISFGEWAQRMEAGGPTESYTSPDTSPEGFTPEGYRTPFISKSRFGYTDPTVRVLNLPFGKHFKMDTPLHKTVVLTSPSRDDPVLVNIEVDPKPLKRTESGEHFVCDISLDVQPGPQDVINQQKRPRRIRPTRPTVTYGIPPEVTPTSTRRHGLFTPTGIFRKRHYNIRRVPGEHCISEMPWSSPEDFPHLHENYGIPPEPFLPSPPPDYSDRSMSWERSYGSTPESSPCLSERPPYQPPGTDERNQSPLIKRTFYGRHPPGSDERSPSPLIKRTFDRRHSPGSDERSPSPLIKRTFDRRHSPGSDERRSDNNFEESFSPVINRSSYVSSPENSFQRSPSPAIESRFYEQQTSPSFSTSNRSASPAIESRFYEQQTSPSFSTSDRSASPAIESGYYEERTSPSFSTSDRSASPVIQEPRYSYQSSESSSPYEPKINRLKREFYRNQALAQDNSFASSRSSTSPVAFDVSPQPMPGSPIYGTPPSGYQADLDSSGSPETERMYNRSSPGVNQSLNSEYIEDPLNSRIRLDTWPQTDLRSPESRYREDPLNKRVRFDETNPDRMGSFSPQRYQTSDSDAEFSSYGHSADPLNRRMQFDDASADPLNRRMQFDDALASADPLNRRMQFDNALASTSGYGYQDPLQARMRFGNLTETGEEHFSRSPSPDSRPNSRGSGFNKTFNSGASEFDDAYLEGSLSDRSLLNESMYHRSP